MIDLLIRALLTGVYGFLVYKWAFAEGVAHAKKVQVYSPLDLGSAVCKALGIDPNLTVSADLHIGVGEIPTITVRRYADSSIDLGVSLEQFELVPREPKVFTSNRKEPENA
jgi:hypothetical protein